ncbi:MAG: hypothetical protein V7720_12480 [Halioglobus sp.]
MKAFLAIPAMFIAINAAAQCPAERPSTKPELEVSYSSTKTELFAAQTQAQAYVDSVVSFLNCQDRRLSPLEFNFYVVAAEDMAAQYNEVLRAYRQNKEALAIN